MQGAQVSNVPGKQRLCGARVKLGNEFTQKWDSKCLTQTLRRQQGGEELSVWIGGHKLQEHPPNPPTAKPLRAFDLRLFISQESKDG